MRSRRRCPRAASRCATTARSTVPSVGEARGARHHSESSSPLEESPRPLFDRGPERPLLQCVVAVDPEPGGELLRVSEYEFPVGRHDVEVDGSAVRRHGELDLPVRDEAPHGRRPRRRPGLEAPPRPALDELDDLLACGVGATAHSRLQQLVPARFAGVPAGSAWSGPIESGCPDLNRGPLRPERSALTKLRHSPSAPRGEQRATLPRPHPPASGLPLADGPFAPPGVPFSFGVRSRGPGPAWVATTRATRRLSISATFRSHSPTRTSSPSAGMWPKRSKSRPPSVTYSPSGISIPRRSRTSSTLVWPSMSHRVLSTRTMSASSSSSNSSCRSPTKGSKRSLTVRRPATPPYSSTTTATARRCLRMSASASSTLSDSGSR